MKNTFKILISLFFVSAFVITSCVKDDFDQPEIPDPCDVSSGFTPNITVAGIAAMFNQLEAIEESAVKVFPDTNVVLEAQVVSSDETGNFYKALYLEDETGAVMLSIEGANLFNDYPLGQKVHLNLSGLTVEFDSWVSIHEIGMGTFIENGAIKGIGRIPVSSLPNFLKNESCPLAVTPTVIDLLSNDLNNLGRLVTIEDVQIAQSDIDLTYADAESNPPQNASITVEDCQNNTIVLRNSGYASFAGFNVPDGKGSITGIYTKYGSTYQIIIRDTTDLQFTGHRCGYFEGGTFDEPIDVAKAIEQAQFSSQDLWVKGYIVGTYVNDWQYTDFFDNEAPFTVNNLVFIADSPSETSMDNMILVQLDQDDVKAATNIKDNESLLGKQIKYYGDLGSFSAKSSMSNTEGYWLIEANEGINPQE